MVNRQTYRLNVFENLDLAAIKTNRGDLWEQELLSVV